jgi:hypothetical protein
MRSADDADVRHQLDPTVGNDHDITRDFHRVADLDDRCFEFSHGSR